jgi:RNA polymerase sigma factor (sigma-70 family)
LLSASLQHLGRTLLAADLAGCSDAELVRRFVEQRDDGAFTALVRRHGAVVLGVCRRVLRHEQDAEDAFQATFLVLARNAASVQRPAGIGNWLYGVAYNVARKAKALRQRRQARERDAAAHQQAAETRPDDAEEWQEILDQELNALPDRYRTPLVLCDLMGLTIREAAAAAGCPPKTLGTRLSRGRALLAGRLTRRGVAVSVGALALTLARWATAAPPARLIGPTVTTAMGFLIDRAAASPAVAALTQGVSSIMLPKTFKYVALLACGILAATGLIKHVGHAVRAAPTPSAQKVTEKDAPAFVPAARPAPALDPLHELHRILYNLFTSFTQGPTEQKKPADAPAGTWAREGGEQTIEFGDKNTMKISAHKGDLIIACEFTREKELLKASITGIEGKEELREKAKEKLPIGFKFEFKWKVKGDLATLDDLKGENTELLRAHLEGDYKAKK